MCATTGHLADARRRRRSITPRGIAGTSIPLDTFTASPASSRPTPTAATTSCTIPRARRDRSPRPCAGRTRAGSTSSWPTSRPMPGVEGMQRRSRRSRSKRSSASTRCSISNAASMAKALRSVCGCAGSRVRRLWRRSKPGCASNGPVSHARLRSPSRSTTCCGVGIGLSASSMMAESASPTIRPNGRCADLPRCVHCAPLSQVSVNIAS
jgi:hypothetical protein